MWFAGVPIFTGSLLRTRSVPLLLVVGPLFALLACKESFLSERVPEARVTSVTVTPDTATILLQGALPLVATLRDSAGNVVTGDTVVWSVRGTVGNTIGIRTSAISSAGGLTAGLYQDSLIITADADGGLRGTAIVRVRYGRPYRVIVRPDSTWLPLGSEVPLLAFVRDSLGNGLPFHLVSWTSSDEGVATVAPIGIGTDQIGRVQATVTARATGTATIAAAAGGIITSAVIIAETVQFSELSAGDVRACGIALTGSMYCWGDNYGPVGTDPDSVGTLGAGIPSCGSYCGSPSLAGFDNPPVRVRTTTQFASLARATGAAACALTSTGAVYCWGSLPGQSIPYPTRLAPGYSFADFEVARGHLCGVSITGAAYCWGWNQFGQLGASSPEFCVDASGFEPCSDHPIAVSGTVSFQTITSGNAHVCGLASNGVAYCWGLNDSGQLGDGSTVNRNAPTPVTGGYMFRALTAGGGFTCGTTTDSTVFCWGNGTGDELGVPAHGVGFQSSVPIRVVGQP